MGVLEGQDTFCTSLRTNQVFFLKIPFYKLAIKVRRIEWQTHVRVEKKISLYQKWNFQIPRGQRELGVWKLDQRSKATERVAQASWAHCPVAAVLKLMGTAQDSLHITLAKSPWPLGITFPQKTWIRITKCTYFSKRGHDLYSVLVSQKSSQRVCYGLGLGWVI